MTLDFSTTNHMRGFMTRHTAGVLMLMGIAAFYLLTEHRAHVMGLLPWALLALCPLMHLFMHRGHESPHDSHRSSQQKDGPP